MESFLWSVVNAVSGVNRDGFLVSPGKVTKAIVQMEMSVSLEGVMCV